MEPLTTLPLPPLEDEAGERLGDGLPLVVDAHVHVFPDPLGLKGVKLHSHVQCFDMDSPQMPTVYRTCGDNARALFKINLHTAEARAGVSVEEVPP